VLKIYFNIDEFCITKGMIPQEIANKILYHISIINPIRVELGHPIYVSKNSGYRPKWYELSRGRSGNSEHCYVNKGAADYTCRKSDIRMLLHELLNSEYMRVCYYPNDNFIHCDLKGSIKQYYIDYGNGWYLQK